MKRIILLYGLSAGLLIAALQFVQYRFLVVEHSLEIYGAMWRFCLPSSASASDKR